MAMYCKKSYLKVKLKRGGEGYLTFNECFHSFMDIPARTENSQAGSNR